MSQRIAKVESLVRQVVATAIREHVAESARITVTAVDVSPDMRHAVVWLGIVADNSEVVFESAKAETAHIQADLAAKMTTKFVPRIDLRHDEGGEHAEHISRLIQGL